MPRFLFMDLMEGRVFSGAHSHPGGVPCSTSLAPPIFQQYVVLPKFPFSPCYLPWLPLGAVFWLPRAVTDSQAGCGTDTGSLGGHRGYMEALNSASSSVPWRPQHLFLLKASPTWQDPEAR